MKSEIIITGESRFPINRKNIRSTLREMLEKNRIVSDVHLEVCFVGDRKMKSLNFKYRNLDHTTSVLAFALEEPTTSPFVPPPDGVLRLGSIVISYPQAVARAGEDEMLVDDKINQLVEHGMKHLLGISE